MQGFCKILPRNLQITVSWLSLLNQKHRERPKTKYPWALLDFEKIWLFRQKMVKSNIFLPKIWIQRQILIE